MDENKKFDEFEETPEQQPEENNETAVEENNETPVTEEFYEEDMPEEDVLSAVNDVDDDEEASEDFDAVPEADTVTDDEPALEYDVDEEPEEIKKGSKIGIIIAVIAAVVVIAIAAMTSMMETNKYNKMGYVDISGKTVQDLIDQQGITLEEFLETYGLPSDMPADTIESAAYYTIPVKNIAQMYGMDFESLKEKLQFPDTITEDSTWGEAEGEVTLANYIGEDNLEEFKQQYGLGDNVTGETKWKEIRNTVDEKQKAQREEQEKAQAEAEKNKDSETADSAEDNNTEDASADADTETE